VREGVGCFGYAGMCVRDIGVGFGGMLETGRTLSLCTAMESPRRTRRCLGTCRRAR
jgi:hypothetical protein